MHNNRNHLFELNRFFSSKIFVVRKIVPQEINNTMILKINQQIHLHRRTKLQGTSEDARPIAQKKSYQNKSLKEIRELSKQSYL